MNTETIVSLALFVVLVTLITVLLWRGKIKAASYTVLLPAVCFLSLLYQSFDRLRELDAKNLRVVLNEVRQAREDVYAKADAVRRLVEQIADLSALSVQMSPAWVDITTNGLIVQNCPQPLQLIAARDRMVQLLRDVGSSGPEVEGVRQKLDNVVLKSLKGSAWLQFTEYRADNQPEVEQGTRHFLFENYDRGKLTEFLKAKQRWKPEFDRTLDQIDKFLRDKTL